ncbi:hypothetical protein [Emticicia sp. 17c]|uniref:hypothetical protein n=1 Tax=Emticicia sp. 17c TaxID=3127704 RepID=UPI00301B7B28
MKKLWIASVMSLMLMLIAGSNRTLAQSSYQIGMSEIRKANQTKARLDSALASGFLLQVQLKAYKDSSRIYRDSSLFFQYKLKKEQKRKGIWRKLALGEGLLIALGIITH